MWIYIKHYLDFSLCAVLVACHHFQLNQPFVGGGMGDAIFHQKVDRPQQFQNDFTIPTLVFKIISCSRCLKVNEICYFLPAVPLSLS